MMKKPLQVLILEDSPDDTKLLLLQLEQDEIEVEWQRVETEADFRLALDTHPDLILADYSLPSYSGLKALELRNELGLDIPFILISGTIGEEIAVKAMKYGAADYLLKDRLTRLGEAVRHALEQKQLHDQQRISEEALRASEERLRLLSEAAHDLTTLVNRQWIIEYTNTYAAQQFGVSSQELIGKRLTEIFPAEIANRQQTNLQKVFDSGQPLYIEAPSIFQGTTIWLGSWLVPVKDKLSDEAQAVLVVSRDITERKRAEEEISYHAHLLRHINDAVIATDAQFRITAWNRAAQAIYGWTIAEVMGHNVADILSSGLTDPQRAEAKKLLQEESSTRSERIHSRKNGQPVFVEENSIVLFDEHRRVSGYVSVNRDITERKQAEEALRQSEERYRSLFEDSPISLWLEDFSGVKQHLDEWKEKGITDIPAYLREHPDLVTELARHVRILDVNNAAMKLYHARQKSELLGNLTDVLRTMPLEQFENELIQIANGRLNFEREEVDHTLTGEKIDVNVRWSVAPGYEDSLAKVIVSTLDITEHKQVQDEIRRLKEFHENLINNMCEGIVVQNTQGYLTYANPAASALTGYVPEELLGGHWTKFIPADQHAIIKAADERRLAGGSSQYEIDFLHKSGKRINMLVSGSPVFENGPFHGSMAVFTDITGRRQAEQALRESQEKLQNIIRHSSSMFYTHTTDHMLVYVSQQAREVLDCEPEEAMVRWQDFISDHPSNRQGIEATERAILTGERQPPYELELITGKGRRIWVQVDESPVVRDGKTAAIVGSITDITARKRSENKVKTQLERQTALRQIDRAIISTSNVQLSLGVLLSQTLSLLRIDACDVLLVNPVMNFLEYAAGLGFRTKIIENSQIRMGEGLAGRAALTRETVRVDDLGKAHLHPDFIPLMQEEGFVEYVGIPLIAKGKVVGVLEIYQRSAVSHDPEWLDFLESLGDQASIAIDNAQSFEGMQHLNMELVMAYDATIEGWSRAMDLRDKETEGHTQRVTDLTLKLAERMGIGHSELVHIRRGALLHDIGKLGVPDSILLKPGTLTEEEWEIMKRHPTLAREMLSSIVYLRYSIDIPYCHHEKWDGSGYPQGLKGEQIPLVARLFSIVDVWDALTSHRPYRPAWTVEETLRYIREQSGKHFDPQIVETFMGVIAGM